jgi:hypothetical protein
MQNSSCFINEIDEQYLEYTTPMDDYKYKPLLSVDIWDESDKSKLRWNLEQEHLPALTNLMKSKSGTAQDATCECYRAFTTPSGFDWRRFKGWYDGRARLVAEK